MRIGFIYVLAFCILEGCPINIAFARPSPDEISRLNTKVNNLEKRIVELEARVAELEGRASVTPRRNDQTTPSKIGWKNKENWRALRKGMSSSEVHSLLGEPGKVVTWDSGKFWYYPDVTGGSVTFDGEEHVSGWSEP